MPINPNDLSINTPILNSKISAVDYERITNNARGGRSNLTQSIANYKRSSAAKNTLRFPLDTPKYYLEMQIAKYDRADLFKLNFSTEATILLPLSSQINDSDAVKYDEQDVGMFAGPLLNIGTSQAKNMMSNQESFMDKIKNIAEELNNAEAAAAGGIAGAKLALTALKEGAKRTLLSAIGGGTYEAALGIAGYSPNQFFTVLMRGPTYKTYGFAWKLYPKNLQESNAILDIINTLQNAKAVGLAGNGVFWEFPKVFKLGYRPNAKYLHKFKPAVLSRLNVDFAPGGTPAFYSGDDNPPEAIIIAAEFIEMEYWLTGDYNDNPDPFWEGGDK